jgi:endo-1,4-beta-mannosidase
LTETDLKEVDQEFDLIQGAGFNTVRIFLWYAGLFNCPGSGAVPNPDAFARLDGVLKLAAQHKLHVIVTLNDLPDLTMHPLYTEPDSAAAETAYLVKRYQNEGIILAWDVRNEGDSDYGAFSAPVVLNWLKQTIAQIRQLDSNHLITAGWGSNAQATIGLVDFVSFHYYGNLQGLMQRLNPLRAITSKPILLEESGVRTFGVSEQDQSSQMHDALAFIDSSGSAGWVVWTAFDFPRDATCIPPACPDKENGQQHFGLWHTDYTPKAAVDMLKSVP